MNVPPFRYVRWFKERHPRARISLASSGMDTPPEAIFPVHRLSWRMDIHDSYGYEPLCQRVAHHLGLPPERIVVVPGCTYACHAAARAITPVGGTVLVESPTYDLMARLPELLGARLRRVRRRDSEDFRLMLGDLEACLEDPVDALYLTVPHNPSLRTLADDQLAELAALAEAHDFRILADEVYLDFFPPPLRPYRTLAAFSDRFIVSGSLTKVQGLANLRVGWVAGPSDLIERVRRFNEYLADRLPAFDSQAAVLAFDCMDALLDRAYRMRDENFPIVAAWADAHPAVELVDPGAGINTIVRIPEGIDTLALAEELLERDGVLVAPADMFGGKAFLRISFGIPPADLERGLEALGRALARALNMVS